MATYAIGDLQGCSEELQDLLNEIDFDAGEDHLWFTGDLVNRGPDSLAALRRVHELGDNAAVVLGNHDLHLLAIASGSAKPRHTDTLDDVLSAPDRSTLLEWLRGRPLVHHDASLGFTMVHAGFAPQWTLDDALALAGEVETMLRSDEHANYLGRMYGDHPKSWSDHLSGWERLRFITNCMTRLRFCGDDGRLALGEKGAPGSQPPGTLPWYRIPDRRTAKARIIFGHWSVVHQGTDRNFDIYNVFPLDTGCVWGGALTALRLDDRRLFSVPSRQPNPFNK